METQPGFKNRTLTAGELLAIERLRYKIITDNFDMIDADFMQGMKDKIKELEEKCIYGNDNYANQAARI